MTAKLRDPATGQYQRTRFDEWTPERWEEGWVDPKGYFRVYMPSHPSATSAGWVHRHHAHWWIVKGERITRGMVLHHDNEIKTDDRIENLVLMTHGEHTRHHSAKPPLDLVCTVCGGAFRLPQWRINQGRGRYCSHACYAKDPVTDERKAKQSAGLRLAYAEGRR